MRKRILIMAVAILAAVTAIAVPSGSDAYSYSGHHWDYGNPTYVDVAIKSEVPSAWGNAIAYSMSTWNKAGAKFRFRAGYAGHTVGFRYLSKYPTALAVTYTTVSGTRILDSDVDINSKFSWDVNGASYKYDVQNIMTHEFGHWLRLADLYASSDFWKTMYGSASPGETYKRTLDQDDINGIRAIYGSI